MASDADPDDLPKNELEFVRQWLEAIELSGVEEKTWRDVADRACDTYRGGAEKTTGSDNHSNLNTFNIFHSNVETLVPALYNSTPVPDVRRRFNDEDPIGKEVSDILERSLSYQIDAYDFDNTMLSSVRDMAITSRGIARVRYEPTVALDDDGAPKEKTYEQVTCEYVPWRTFRRGPAKIWRDVPWIAFELYLSYGDVEKLLADEKDKEEILKGLKFSYSAEPKKNPEQQGENLSKLASRARIWEIWDKDNRQVHFIAPDYASKRLTSVDDPLEVQDFFPIPRPLAALMSPDSLVPITLLQIYESLLEELNIVQRRILRLTAQLRPRGIYAGLQAEIKQVTEADDGELIAAQSAEMFATTGGGLDKAIAWFPLEATTAALEQLVLQREQIKSTIYEVTGLSDIIRGESNPNETATAQQIKSNWGSLRIQKMQAEVGRFARDLFRLKAEIMANKFSFQTFSLMTGLNYPTQAQQQQAQQIMQQGQQALQGQPVPPELQDQAKKLQEILAKPAQEQVEQMLRNDAVRGFRVDIESDSTIRGDAQRNQEQMGLFLTGTANYLKSVGPLVQAGAMPADVAIEIFAAFSRSFRLGKQAEDALDRMADQAKQSVGQPKPPSPEEIKMQIEQAKLEMDKQRMTMEMQFKQKELELETQKAQLDAQIKQQQFVHDTKLKEMELQHDMQLRQQEAEQKAQQSAQEAAMKMEINRTQAVEDIKTKGIQSAQKIQQDGQSFEHERVLKQQAFQTDEQRKQTAFQAEQARREAADRDMHEHRKGLESQSAAERSKQPKAGPKRIKVKRDAEGRAAEYEVH